MRLEFPDREPFGHRYSPLSTIVRTSGPGAGTEQVRGVRAAFLFADRERTATSCACSSWMVTSWATSRTNETGLSADWGQLFQGRLKLQPWEWTLLGP
jgi:hypothetical protein